MSNTLYQVLSIRTIWCVTAFPIFQRGKWKYVEIPYFIWGSKSCKQLFPDLKPSGFTPGSVSLNIMASHLVLPAHTIPDPRDTFSSHCRFLLACSPKHWRFSEILSFSQFSIPLQSYLHWRLYSSSVSWLSLPIAFVILSVFLHKPLILNLFKTVWHLRWLEWLPVRLSAWRGRYFESLPGSAAVKV